LIISALHCGCIRYTSSCYLGCSSCCLISVSISSIVSILSGQMDTEEISGLFFSSSYFLSLRPTHVQNIGSHRLYFYYFILSLPVGWIFGTFNRSSDNTDCSKRSWRIYFTVTVDNFEFLHLLRPIHYYGHYSPNCICTTGWSLSRNYCAITACCCSLKNIIVALET
jgi:hypothetical protein